MTVHVVSLDNRGFHPKLEAKTKESIRQAGYSLGQPADITHFVRIVDTKKLYEDIKDDYSGMEYSFLMTGYSYILRNPEQEEAFLKLLELPQVRRVFINTSLPSSLSGFFVERYGYVNDKIKIIFDLPFENKEYFRSISREEARKKLNIPEGQYVALYFGTYFFSKGADLLLEVAKELPEIDFYMVGDTKLESFHYDIKTKTQSSNVHWIDEYVSEDTARDYFRACDCVVMPYRRYYEHDPSGVFTEAMMCERPVIVPDIMPFCDVLDVFDVGLEFETENNESLKRVLNFKSEEDELYDEFDDYLNLMYGWEVIGENL